MTAELKELLEGNDTGPFPAAILSKSRHLQQVWYQRKNRYDQLIFLFPISSLDDRKNAKAINNGKWLRKILGNQNPQKESAENKIKIFLITGNIFIEKQGRTIRVCYAFPETETYEKCGMMKLGRFYVFIVIYTQQWLCEENKPSNWKARPEAGGCGEGFHSTCSRPHWFQVDQ